MTLGSSRYHASRVLDEPSLLPAHAGCPWCGSARRSEIGAVQESPLVKLLHCEDCHAASVSRMPTSAALEDFYSSYYQDEKGADGDGKITFGDTGRMAAHLVRWIAPAGAGPSARILDFGGGDGTLAALAAARAIRAGVLERAEVVVVDRSGAAPASVHPAVGVAATGELSSLPGGSFDFVIASAVMEHIPEGRPVLEQLLGKVRPGGVFYARTPCIAPFMRLVGLLGRRWDLTFPAHVHDLGQAFWEGQFGAGGAFPGFKIASSRPSIVEASFRTEFVKAAISLSFKLPWWLLGRSWSFVGGWEIAARRQN